MRSSTNNHYQTPLPFTDIQIHSNKFSEDDTGYDSLPNQSEKQQRMKSIAGLSSTSSSSLNNQYDRIMNFIKSIPSPTDISTRHDGSDISPSVAQRIAEFSKKPQTTTPMRKLNRTRIQPIPDSTSDSADSFALSNHLVLVSPYQQQISSIDIPPFGGNLEYIHDDRFDSTTTVDHVKNDVVAIELMEQEPTRLDHKQHLSWIKRFGESIRLLPANILAVVFISLFGGLIVSAILVIIIV